MTRHGKGVPDRQLRREVNRLFEQRLRVSLWFILLATLGFAALNLRFNPEEAVAVQWLRILQAAVIGTAIYSLGWRHARARPEIVAFCTVMVISLTSAAATVVIQVQAESAMLLGFMVIVFGSATLFPWRVRYQAATAAITSGCIFVALHAQRPPSVISPATVLMVLLAASMSVYFSLEIRRAFETIASQNLARAQGDHALRESEARARAIVNTAPDPILTFDENGTLISFNPAAEPVFAVASEEAIGMAVERFLPGLFPGPRRDGDDTNGEPAHELQGTRRELTAVRLDGVSFPADVTTSALHLVDRLIFTAIVRDITERKRVEELLAARVQERARALDAQTLFLAASSHDVRGSLAIIVGLSEMLSDLTTDPQALDLTQRIRHIAHTLAEIMSELLQYATMSHADAITPAPACARALLQEVTGHYEPLCREKGLALRIHLPEAGELNTDSLKLKRIVQNLLSNAIRYTPHGSIEVRGELDGETLRFSVADTGIGMSAEDVELVFDPFYRLPAARSLEPLGTGLGLATVKTLCSQLGGSVRISSQPGLGSTFFVDVPRRWTKGVVT